MTAATDMVAYMLRLASPAARSTVENAMPKAMITFVGSVIQRKLCATR